MPKFNNMLELSELAGDAELVLASSSRYRRELLERLRVPFICHASHIDESLRPGEPVSVFVERLAMEKAGAVAALFPGRLIIGSDQACVIDGHLLRKPGTVEAAVEQLLAASGRTVTFLTGVCVLAAGSGRQYLETVPCEVRFRELDRAQITAYVHTERPLDCAGGFKSEGLGITLFESMRCEDPTALPGLPLITLVRLLAKHGYDVFQQLPQHGHEVP